MTKPPERQNGGNYEEETSCIIYGVGIVSGRLFLGSERGGRG